MLISGTCLGWTGWCHRHYWAWGCWGPDAGWGLGARERESRVWTCKELLGLEKQLDVEWVPWRAIGSRLLPKEGNADRFFFSQTSTLALPNYQTFILCLWGMNYLSPVSSFYWWLCFLPTYQNELIIVWCWEATANQERRNCGGICKVLLHIYLRVDSLQ